MLCHQALGLGGCNHVRLQQSVHVHHHIFHLSIVNRPLRRRAPCLFGAFEVGKDADDVHRLEVNEVERLGVLDATTEDEMKFAVGHVSNAF
jgi:hypothetical protein